MSRINSSLTQDASSGRSVAPVRWSQLYLALSFTTLATLVLELALTRIFSVVFYYHFAFLAISIALFGMGAGGVFSYVVAARTVDLYRSLGNLLLADSVAVVAALWFLLSRSGDLSYSTLAAVYLAAAVPFFLAGAVVSLAIAEAIERVDRAYFFDLAGAAAGCLTLIFLLNLLGGPNTIIAAAVFYAVAAAVWFNQAGAWKSRAAAVSLALLLTGLIVINAKAHVLDIRSAKGHDLPPERFSAWNSFSRIGVTRDYVSWEPSAAWAIIIDADAGTGISPFDWDRGLSAESRARLLHQGPGLPYALRPGAKTLVIGAGGGYDVARALASGSRDITAVEINPIIATTIMRDRLRRPRAIGLYFRPEVQRGGRGRPLLRSRSHREISGAPGHSGGHLGLHRRRGLRAFGKQPVHDRCLLRLPVAPDGRWRPGLHALGLRSAARIAAADHARHGRARRASAKPSPRAMSSPCATIRAAFTAGERTTPS